MKTVGTLMNTSVDDLTERIEILRYSESRDEDGNIIQSVPIVVLSCKAKVLPISAASRGVDNETANQVTYRVIIRYGNVQNLHITQTDVIMWRGKKLMMNAPPYDAESRRTWYVMECKEMIEDV